MSYPTARQRIDSFPESVYKQQLGEQFEQIEVKLLGLAGKIDQLSRQGVPQPADPLAAQLAELQKQFRDTNLQIAQLMRRGATADRLDEAAKLARQSGGVLGLIKQLDASVNLINHPYERSSSSFDSDDRRKSL